MTIKAALLETLPKKTNEFISGVDLVKKVIELTGLSYNSVYNNVNRNKKAFPFLFSEYEKVDGIWSRKENKGYNQEYKKPKEYFESLKELNSSDTIYTLCGTQSYCCSVLDKSKTIKVDFSPLTEPDILGDIFKIEKKENSSYNLDFEGILTKKKVKNIDELNAKLILLTMKKSNNNSLLKNLNNYNHNFITDYRSNRSAMSIYRLERVEKLFKVKLG